MTREEAIKLIGDMKCDLVNHLDDNDLTALEMAIASLKTDEAYQLEYENRDFVEIPKGMTNGDVLKAIFPKLITNERYVKSDNLIEVCLDIDEKTYSQFFVYSWWNAPYKRGE